MLKHIISVVSLLATVSKANPIEHVIVLMMENRSFDHYLGWLTQLNPDIDGLTGSEYNCVNPSQSGSSGCVFVNKNGYDTSLDDPRHDFDSITEQVFGFDKAMSDETSQPAMDGFVWNAQKNGGSALNVMSMFTNASAPVLNTLAIDYALFDDWFCSVPGPTDPNRYVSVVRTFGFFRRIIVFLRFARGA